VARLSASNLGATLILGLVGQFPATLSAAGDTGIASHRLFRRALFVGAEGQSFQQRYLDPIGT
jgi:hypothetical protein